MANTSEIRDLFDRFRKIDQDLAHINNSFTQLEYCLEEFNRSSEASLSEIYQVDEDNDLFLLGSSGKLKQVYSPLAEFVSEEAALNQLLLTEEAVLMLRFEAHTVSAEELYWSGFPLYVNDNFEGLLLYLTKNEFQPKDIDLTLDFFLRRFENVLCQAFLKQERTLRSRREEYQQQAISLQDSVSQLLYSISLGARSASAAAERMPEKLPHLLDYIASLAHTGQLELQTLKYELQPELFREEGLIEAIWRQVELLESHQDLEVEAKFCEEPRLDWEAKTAVYRIVQEAVRNIIAHAQATQVHISLNENDHSYLLLIRDNGLGFDPQESLGDATGIQLMQTYAAACSASFKILSRPSEGTEIYGIFPASA